MIRGTYVIKRLVAAVLSLFGVATIAFVLFRIVPGDPARLMTAPGIKAEDIERLRASLGLSDPLHIQYVNWLSGLMHLDFGRSYWLKAPALDVILERLPATLELVFASIIIATVLGVIIGVVSVMKAGRLSDKVATSASFIGFSIPDFLWGVLFVIIFGGLLKLLPVSGRIDPAISLKPVTNFMVIDSILQVNFIALQSSLTHLLLPSLALALGLIAIIHRTLRSSLLDILQEDYILTDRSKGLPEWYIFFVRAFKNGALPVLTIIGVQISFVIGGSVIIELIYGWPGIGTLSLISVNRRDLPVVQGIIVIYSLITIIINLAVDFLYTKLNPKITYG